MTQSATGPVVTARDPEPTGSLPKTPFVVGVAAVVIAIVLAVLVFGGGSTPDPDARSTAAPPIDDDGTDRVQQSAEVAEDLRLLQIAERDLEAAKVAGGAQGGGVASVALGTGGGTPQAGASEAADAEAQQRAQLKADRLRRDEESRYASPVAATRRPAGEMVSSGDMGGGRLSQAQQPTDDTAAQIARLDEMSASLMRGLQPTAATVAGDYRARQREVAGRDTEGPQNARDTAEVKVRRGLHRIWQGRFLDGVLTNRIDGSAESPVVAILTHRVSADDGVEVMPQGTKVIGTASPVSEVGQQRVAVTFERLIFPNGEALVLPASMAVSPQGDGGLTGDVNSHAGSMFAAAALGGVITGLAQLVTGGGYGSDNRGTTVVIGGGGEAAAQVSSMMLQRQMGRLPTITIPEGTRLKVYVGRDLDLPPYAR